MNVRPTGSAELDRALIERARIHSAWGMEDIGRLPHARQVTLRSDRYDHFGDANEMVINEVDPILVNFKTRTITRGGEKVQFGRLAFRLMTALLASEWPLTKDELIWHLYGDDICGGPDYARGALRRIIFDCRNGSWWNGHRSRPKLHLLGLRIVTDVNRGYTIVKD